MKAPMREYNTTLLWLNQSISFQKYLWFFPIMPIDRWRRKNTSSTEIIIKLKHGSLNQYNSHWYLMCLEKYRKWYIKFIAWYPSNSVVTIIMWRSKKNIMIAIQLVLIKNSIDLKPSQSIGNECLVLVHIHPLTRFRVSCVVCS